MHKYHLYYLTILFLFKTSTGNAHMLNKSNALTDDDLPSAKKEYYLFSSRVSITVPHPTANNAFKKSFIGIYSFNIDFNVMAYKGLYIGATYKNTLLKITPNKIASYNVDSLGQLNPYPTMNSNNIAIKAGYDFYIGEQNKLIYSVGMALGKNWTKYNHLVCKTANKTPVTNFNTTYIEPEMGLFFLVEPNFAIGATISYTLLNKNFNPSDLCLNDWKSYNKSNENNIQYINFGFGFYYSFLKKGK